MRAIRKGQVRVRRKNDCSDDVCDSKHEYIPRSVRWGARHPYPLSHWVSEPSETRPWLLTPICIYLLAQVHSWEIVTHIRPLTPSPQTGHGIGELKVERRRCSIRRIPAVREIGREETIASVFLASRPPALIIGFGIFSASPA